ncbi:DeoR family transcriptional regulator [Streptococcus sanguinis]|uniref:DeoR/GlpR transcriptional regulator n=1 Tax=Streptococcus sanguinis TaxID=1305 RepID=A0A7H8V3F4_STRSA|nr:DeoR/GlpR transcriptional regulator [Streptococcus sanguinis]
MNIRQEKICELVKEKNFMSIMELSKQLHYSESTVRRDLTVLENLKMIKRISGGAIYCKRRTYRRSHRN